MPMRSVTGGGSGTVPLLYRSDASPKAPPVQPASHPPALVGVAGRAASASRSRSPHSGSRHSPDERRCAPASRRCVRAHAGRVSALGCTGPTLAALCSLPSSCVSAHRVFVL